MMMSIEENAERDFELIISVNFSGLNLCYDVCCPATRAVLRYDWRRHLAND